MFRNRSLILKFCFFTQPTPNKLIKDSQKIGVSTITPDPYYSNNQYMMATQTTKKQHTEKQMDKSMHMCSEKPNYFHMLEHTTSLDVLLPQDSSGQYSGKENPFDAHFRKAAEAVKQGRHT